ncbi:TPR-like protein [Xylariaceae sp. FL0804]|nr:TPR-like protein [Xylariaceae sp. FL0804]
MHIEEISDEVAERLKLDESRARPQAAAPSGSRDSSADSAEHVPPRATPATTALFPELSPGRAMTERKTVDEVAAELRKTPFFMTELEENDDTEALKALAYEGTPSENAADFKERGNECFRLRRWADAKEFYTKGVLILAAEERKRKQNPSAAAAATPTAAATTTTGSKAENSTERNAETTDGAEGEKKKKEVEEERPEEEQEGDEAEGETRRQRALLESLHVNRAACHLELRNYRSCWLDGAAALRLNPRNVKAYYRSARALLAVGRTAEADEACAGGLALEPANAPLRALATDIVTATEAAAARTRRDAEREATGRRRAALVKAALAARGIRTRSALATGDEGRAPDLEDARVHLAPDPDSASSALVFPALLLYPLAAQSDLVKAFAETDAPADHLAYVLPPPWDGDGDGDGGGAGGLGEYASAAAVECYMETAAGGLVRVGRRVPLLKMLYGGRCEVVDGLVRIYVLPRARAADWVRDFKSSRAAGGKSGSGGGGGGGAS